MIKHQYIKTIEMIEHRRFQLLLFSTLLVLILPAYSGKGLLSEILFLVSMSFLFMQSMIAADVQKSRRILIRSIVFVMIVLIALKPAGMDSFIIDVFKLACIAVFFCFVVVYLFKYIMRSKTVSFDVLITSVNIYLLLGIIFACLTFMHYLIVADAYNFPEFIANPGFTDFTYYSFITMSTVGYGDITPRIPETQTLAYLISVTGQLYVAIIIAFLVGKLLVAAQK